MGLLSVTENCMLTRLLEQFWMCHLQNKWNSMWMWRERFGDTNGFKSETKSIAHFTWLRWGWGWLNFFAFSRTRTWNAWHSLAGHSHNCHPATHSSCYLNPLPQSSDKTHAPKVIHSGGERKAGIVATISIPCWRCCWTSPPRTWATLWWVVASTACWLMHHLPLRFRLTVSCPATKNHNKDKSMLIT